MNKQTVKVKISLPMRYDIPNHNGVAYTKEAIENAFGSSNPYMPILMCGDDEWAYPIGVTDGRYYFDWDDKNKVCNVTLDGYMFNTGADIVVNEMEDEKITDFTIRAISILK